MPNSIVIGSSSESSVGVGTLLKFDSSQVVSVYFNEDSGEWIVEELQPEGGIRNWKCYEVMKFEADLLGANIGECDLKGEV